MLIYFSISILIAFIFYYLIYRIEPFTMPYVPLQKRDLTEKSPLNLNKLITEPRKEYNQELKDWEDYIKIQTEIRNANEVKGTSPDINPEVAQNLRWRIHRWSMWDYLPSLDYPYYCKVQQFNGKETCQPITNKLYCSVDSLYKTPAECLKNMTKINTK